jgi:hypothetical protein
LHRLTRKIREDMIDPENFEQVIDSDEPFKIAKVLVDITGIQTRKQINIQLFDTRNFIGDKSFKIILCMC